MHDLQLFAYIDGQTDTDSAEGALKHFPLPNEPTNEHHKEAKLTIVHRQSLYLKRPLWPPLIPTSRSSQFQSKELVCQFKAGKVVTLWQG